ncbi:MAG: hypothetical protein ACK5L3_00540 [Oscillospiraceae bacterium]
MVLCLIPPLLAIVLLGYVLHSRGGVKAAFAPVLAICCIMLFLVFFGTLNLLFWGRIGLYLFIAAAGGYALVKKPRQLAAYLLSPGVLAFLFGAVALGAVYMANNSFFFMWDDMSHWGPFYKQVFSTNSLHQFTPYPMVHQAYPQGATVFYYFFAWLAPAFSEAHAYVALGVLMCACAAALLESVQWKRPVLAVLSILMVPLFFVLFRYADPYITVYLDTALGAFFGVALVVILCGGQTGLRQAAAVGLVLGALGQIKEMGLLLGLGSLVVFAIVTLHANSGQKSLRQTWRQNVTKRWWASLGIAAAGLLLPILWWKGFLAVTGTAADQFSSPLSGNFLGRVVAAMQGKDAVAASIWEMFTINFGHRAVVYNGYGTPVAAGLLLASGGLAMGLWLWKKKREKGIALALFALPLFFTAYLFAIFYTYVCMMSELEGLRNASYERYLTTFLAGWLMAALAVFLRYSQQGLKKWPGLLPGGAVALVLALQINYCLQFDFLNTSYTRKDAGREGFDAVSGQMLAAMQPLDDVWVIAQNDDGLYRFMYHYTLLPARVSLGLPYTVGSEGAGTDYITPENFAEIAAQNSIEYVVVYITDPEFDQKFGPLFSDGLAYVLEYALPCLYSVHPGQAVPFVLEVETTYP